MSEATRGGAEAAREIHALEAAGSSPAPATRFYVGIPPHTVLIDGDEGRPLPLEPSLKLRSHSPTGFSWGYHGSGPSQLALALLLDHTGNEDVALAHYEHFKRAFVSCFGFGEGFVIASNAIEEWLRGIHNGHACGYPDATL